MNKLDNAFAIVNRNERAIFSEKQQRLCVTEQEPSIQEALNFSSGMPRSTFITGCYHPQYSFFIAHSISMS